MVLMIVASVAWTAMMAAFTWIIVRARHDPSFYHRVADTGVTGDDPLKHARSLPSYLVAGYGMLLAMPFWFYLETSNPEAEDFSQLSATGIVCFVVGCIGAAAVIAGFVFAFRTGRRARPRFLVMPYLRDDADAQAWLKHRYRRESRDSSR